MGDEPLNINFSATGPVQRAFYRSPARVKAIMGPYGSGKTTTCFAHLLKCAVRVPQSPIDGVRRARGVVIRDTYRNLELNTIPSWFKRIPREAHQEFKGGAGGTPGVAKVRFQLGRDDWCDLQLEFVAKAHEQDVQSFVDGFEVSFAFLNGADALPPELLGFIYARLPRYPEEMHRPADWKDHVPKYARVVLDCNAPNTSNWIYQDFVKKRREGFAFFRQPGGLDPGAENLENLSSDYYPNMVATNPEWWVKRFVDNQFGYDRSGKPVYENFDDVLHVREGPLRFERDRKVVVGLDAGRKPAAIFTQRMADGQFRALREFIVHGVSAKRFARALMNFALEQCPQHLEAGTLELACDPAAANPNDTDESTWAEIVSEVTGLTVEPAHTNVFQSRFEAVSDLLGDHLGPSRPGFLLDGTHCPELREGFASTYRYKKRHANSDEVLDTPEKNDASHPHDALQYAALYQTDWGALMGHQEHRRHTREEMDFDPLAA